MNNVLKSEMDVLHNMIYKTLPYCIKKANSDSVFSLNKQQIKLLIKNLQQLSRRIPLRVDNILEVVRGLEERDFKDKMYQDYIRSLKPTLERYLSQFHFNEPELIDSIEYLKQLLTQF